ncbi:site-specific DNA recombinase [Evansella caseinilytica]|uniref:Site-specific DNA recombinase n=1 Tax=Evansella caseinilytica TaxID=1503961 RepID=A0A1H3V3K6_9BACI|nr:site-specific DNA recombinase [Evansella caseinilytica]
MKFEMFSMFAAQYPKTISVSVSSAVASKVRRGEHIGPIPFGYKSVDKKLQINEKEAPTIRQIFIVLRSHKKQHDIPPNKPLESRL